MAKEPTNCCPVAGIGLNFLTPTSPSRPLLDLLGLTDLQLQEYLAEGHPYGFILGHGRNTAFKDYKEAAKFLMERNIPDIAQDRQTKAIFIPETHLPKMPRIVDLPNYESLKHISTDEKLALSGLKRGKVDIANVAGDFVEKELSEALKIFYNKSSVTKVVVLQGPTIRKGRGGNQENDFVIVDHQRKTITCIESKATLSGTAAYKAVTQTLELKQLMEEYFASELASGEWVFVGMIYTNKIKTKKPICASCSAFVIQGPLELDTKLSSYEANLELFRRNCVPSHAEYASLIKGLVFVVLSQPISTHCTIATDVYYKVVGKPAIGKTKAKAGQGDFQSIIFWTNEQAKVMLTERQFVFFFSPWSTGKTLCMRERAVMWATQNQTEKLFFVVVRYERTQQVSLLEMELKDFFHQQHNLHNVEVFGLSSEPMGTLTTLLKEVITRSPGAWMVDELVMPGIFNEEKMKRLHEQFTKELEQLQRHFEAQSNKLLLWFACAGIAPGKAEHFERSYLTSILPPAFYLPEMNVPLRNTKQTLSMAGLEGNTDVKGLGIYDSAIRPTTTNPVYKIPDHLMTGVKGTKFFVNDNKDEEEVISVVEKACREVFDRSGGAGFPLLCCYDPRIGVVRKGVERAGAKALIYHHRSREQCSSEVEVQKWLRRRRSGEEERVLIADHWVSRGWEAGHVLVVDFDGTYGFENLVMRAVGYCAVVKIVCSN